LLAEVRDRSRWLVARCATHQPSARFAVSSWAAPLGWTISPRLATKILLADAAISGESAYEYQNLAETIAASALISVLDDKESPRAFWAPNWTGL